MLLNRNTIFPAAVTAKPIQYALGALRRDFDRIFAATAAPGGRLLLTINHTLAAEQYTLTAGTDTLLLSASDDLGFVYSLFEISRHFLGVQPFWFWNDQPFEVRESVKIPTNTVIESKPARVTYRGWFINDETLLSHWKVERRADLPFIMTFETLLRLGGNMVIPGTGKNAHIYRQAAADMGALSSPTTTPNRWAQRCLPRLIPIWSRCTASTRRNSARFGRQALMPKRDARDLEHRVPRAGR